MSRHDTRFGRRTFLAGLLSGAATAAFANPPTHSVRPVARGEDQRKRFVSTPEELIERARLDGQLSYAVADVESGLVLEARHGATGLPPASVAKALTALYALDVLGPEHRFETQVLAAGVVNDGVLKGDLVLAGGGDPTLETDHLADLAEGLKSAGITEVRGRFVVWGAALPQLREIDRLQPEQVGYNPAVSGLNLNYNRVHFGWKKAGGDYQVSMDARSARYRPDVTMARMRVESRRAPIYTYRDAGGYDDWSVAKGALGDGGARWLPVRKPELYAGEVFQTFARSRGIVLKAPEMASVAPEGEVLARHRSAPLLAILKDMMKYSTNLVAEVIGLSATVSSGVQPATLKASADAMNAWAGRELGMEDVRLVDHSGLGEASRVPAAALAKALVKARDAGLAPLLKEVYLRDSRGRPLYDHPMKIHAKTGTLNFVSGLAGYVRSKEGKELAFAIFAADIERRAALTEAERDRPPGARSWNGRAKMLQSGLLERWGVLYGT